MLQQLKTFLAYTSICFGFLNCDVHASSETLLDLVICSDRSKTKGAVDGPITKLWNEDKANLSYSNTSKTTMDLDDCKVPNVPHIKGDARSYQFQAPIKQVYIERPPTFLVTKTKVDASHNFIGDILENLKKYLEPNTCIKIEWHPYNIFPLDLDDTLKIKEKNPFTGTFNLNVARLAGMMFAERKGIPLQEYSEDTQKEASLIKKRIKTLAQFYQDNSMCSISELKQRLNMEIMLMDHLLEVGQHNVLILKNSINSSLEDFKNAVNKRFHINPEVGLTPQTLYSLLFRGISLEEVKEVLENPHVYSFSDILMNSLFNFVFSDIAVLENKQNVIQYLENNSFQNVSIDRKTGESGRTNVWIVEAYYKK